jgi:hypothetical protein
MIARILSVSALCLLLAGCDDSKNPLSDPQTSEPDERLAGVWRLKPVGIWGVNGGEMKMR